MLRHTRSDETKVQCVASILSASTTDINGASVDAGPGNEVEFEANVGASLDTLSGSVYVLLELEHCNDNATWVDCADADLDVAVAGTNTGTWAKIDDPAEDETLVTVNYIGGKRYVRPVVNKTGTHTNGIPIGVVGRVCAKRYKP